MTRKAQEMSSQKLEEASAWHVRITASDANETIWADFTSWLEADEANRIAFDRIEDLDRELTASSPALASMAAAKAKPRFRPSRWMWTAGATALAASIVLAIVFVTSGPLSREYVTQIGETRTVTMADGTKIDLNTATKILLPSEGSGRHVVLEQGEALFHVAHDHAHPFVVTVGDRDVHDVGTVFNVLRNEGTVTVVVVEGKVAISPHENIQNANEVRLGQGEQFVHSENNGGTTVERVNIAHALAWRDGYLIYDNAPLSKVVSDLNRYFPNRVTLENNAVAIRRFSGALRMDNEDAVLERISRFLPVSVQHRPDGHIVLRNAGNSD
jgi:transmembrane sensor